MDFGICWHLWTWEWCGQVAEKGRDTMIIGLAINHLCTADNLLLPEGFLLTFCIFRMLSGCVRTNRALLRMDLHDAEKGQNGRQKSLKIAFQGILSTVHKRKHHLWQQLSNWFPIACSTVFYGLFLKCKYLQVRMQIFATRVSNICVSTCNGLHPEKISYICIRIHLPQGIILCFSGHLSESFGHKNWAKNTIRRRFWRI